jgi:hypothetical protein
MKDLLSIKELASQLEISTSDLLIELQVSLAQICLESRKWGVGE